MFKVLEKSDIIARYTFERKLFGGGEYSGGKLTPLGERILEASKLNKELSIFGIYSNHVYEYKTSDMIITIQKIDDGEFDTPFEYDVTIEKLNRLY